MVTFPLLGILDGGVDEAIGQDLAELTDQLHLVMDSDDFLFVLIEGWVEVECGLVCRGGWRVQQGLVGGG